MQLNQNNSLDDMRWILVLGGFGIVAGLSTLGYILMRTVGVKLTKVTNSRGFAIELGTSLTIVLGSQFALPLSTTQCGVGAIVGVGMVEKGTKGVNWKLIPRFVIGWIAALVLAGFTSAILFCLGGFAPSMYAVRDRNILNGGIQDFSTKLAAYVLDTNNGVFNTATTSGANAQKAFIAINTTATDLIKLQIKPPSDEVKMLDDALAQLTGGMLKNANFGA